MNTHEIKCLNFNIMSKMRKIMSRVDPQITTSVRPKSRRMLFVQIALVMSPAEDHTAVLHSSRGSRLSHKCYMMNN